MIFIDEIANDQVLKQAAGVMVLFCYVVDKFERQESRTDYK